MEMIDLRGNVHTRIRSVASERQVKHFNTLVDMFEGIPVEVSKDLPHRGRFIERDGRNACC